MDNMRTATPEETALAQIEQRKQDVMSGPPVPLEQFDFFGDTSRNIWTNYNGDNDKRWGFIAAAQSSTVVPAKDFVNKEIKVWLWMVHGVTLNGEAAGEIVETYRTVLVTPERVMIAFVSEGALRSLQQVVQQFGPGPYDPPISLVLRDISTTGGKSFYKLEPAKFDW